MYRINELLQAQRQIFHTNDLAVLWGMENRNTLYQTISRYLDKGVLYQIYRGLYSTVPVRDLDPLDLGPAIIHRYTYLSTESVLAQAGVITQSVHDFTYISSVSRKIELGGWSFRFRQMKPDYLFNPSGIEVQAGRLTATVERAVADILYYDPDYHFDIPELFELDKVRAIQKQVGYANS